jgi:hypothetical protein
MLNSALLYAAMLRVFMLELLRSYLLSSAYHW